jgi:hypothetical protein
MPVYCNTMGTGPSDSATRCVSKRLAPEEASSKPATEALEALQQRDDEGAGDSKGHTYFRRSDSLPVVHHNDDSDCSPETDSSEKIINRKTHRRAVTFSNIEVRQYEITVGDHPCCTVGCPLTLDWEYSASTKQSVEQYEAHRTPLRRSRSELRTTWEERRQILLSEADVSDQELRKANRKLHRARSCSAKLCEKMSESFFQASV